MAKFILGAVLALVLAGCGGGADDAHTAQVASAPPAAALPPIVPASTPAPTCAIPRQVTVTLLGDSTIAPLASGAWFAGNPGDLLQASMDAQFGVGWVIVTDMGVGGTHATDAPAHGGDVVVALYGTNDMRNTAVESLEQFRQAMLGLNATLVLTNYPMGSRFKFDEAAYLAVERGLGLPVGDINSYLRSQRNWETLLDDDDIHPVEATRVLVNDHVIAPSVAQQVAVKRCS